MTKYTETALKQILALCRAKPHYRAMVVTSSYNRSTEVLFQLYDMLEGREALAIFDSKVYLPNGSQISVVHGKQGVEIDCVEMEDFT
jgi:alcohol dehydrogenase class IV